VIQVSEYVAEAMTPDGRVVVVEFKPDRTAEQDKAFAAGRQADGLPSEVYDQYGIPTDPDRQVSR
jgi:hypothetical protein